MGIWGLDEGKMKGRILYSESEMLVIGIREGTVSNNRYWILLFILWRTNQSWLAVWKTLLDGGIELRVHGYTRHHCMDLPMNEEGIPVRYLTEDICKRNIPGCRESRCKDSKTGVDSAHYGSIMWVCSSWNLVNEEKFRMK